MKTKYSLFLKSVFLSSIAALVPSKSNASKYDLNKLKPDNDGPKISEATKSKVLAPKLRLKYNVDNSYLVVAHRSHASHASHHSHYSGYSTGGYYGTSSTPIDKTDQNTTVHWKLGDRVLKKGMKGSDVKQLIKDIVRKGYYKISYMDMPDTNVFTIQVEESVKQFQMADSLKPDGIVGPKTVLYLKK